LPGSPSRHFTAAISAIFSEKVISAVEARYYPGRPAPMETSIAAAIFDGLKLALLSLIVNLISCRCSSSRRFT